MAPGGEFRIAFHEVCFSMSIQSNIPLQQVSHQQTDNDNVIT